MSLQGCIHSPCTDFDAPRLAKEPQSAVTSHRHRLSTAQHITAQSSPVPLQGGKGTAFPVHVPRPWSSLVVGIRAQPFSLSSACSAQAQARISSPRLRALCSRSSSSHLRLSRTTPATPSRESPTSRIDESALIHSFFISLVLFLRPFSKASPSTRPNGARPPPCSWARQHQ